MDKKKNLQDALLSDEDLEYINGGVGFSESDFIKAQNNIRCSYTIPTVLTMEKTSNQ